MNNQNGINRTEYLEQKGQALYQSLSFYNAGNL